MFLYFPTERHIFYNYKMVEDHCYTSSTALQNDWRSLSYQLNCTTVQIVTLAHKRIIKQFNFTTWFEFLVYISISWLLCKLINQVIWWHWQKCYFRKPFLTSVWVGGSRDLLLLIVTLYFPFVGCCTFVLNSQIVFYII